jgi:hypothetical protein
MTTKTETLILEQLAAINSRLEAIEARLDGRLAPGQQIPASPGSFMARRQQCLSHANKKLGRK